APEKAVPWTKPDDWEPDMNNPTAGLGKLFNGVFIVLFADGSVKNISESIDPVVFKAMLTRNGGEAIPPESFSVVFSTSCPRASDQYGRGGLGLRRSRRG